MGRVLARTGARVPSDVMSAVLRAETRIADAERRADEIVRDAAADAESIRERARAEAAADALARREAFEAESRALIAAKGDELVDLALRIGTHLAREAIRVDPLAVKRLVDDAVRRLPAASDAAIRVHPSDAGSLDDPRVVVDDSLEPGDVVVESRIGRVDATFRARLVAVVDALHRAR